MTSLTGRDGEIRADQVRPGDHIASTLANYPAEVLATLTYTNPRGKETVRLTYRDLAGQPLDWNARPDAMVPLATDEEIAEHRALAERTQTLDNVQAWVAWMREHPEVPGPDSIDIHTHLYNASGLATVRQLGALLGKPVRDELDDRTAVELSDRLPRHIVVAWHHDGRPAEPDPEPESERLAPAEWLKHPDHAGTHIIDADGWRDGTWNTPIDRAEFERRLSLCTVSGPARTAVQHGDAGGTAGGPGENAAECLCGTTFSGFDTHAEASAALNLHIHRAASIASIGSGAASAERQLGLTDTADQPAETSGIAL